MFSALRHCTGVFQRGGPWNGRFGLFIDIFLWRVPGRLHGGSWLGCGDCQPWELILSRGQLVTVEAPGYLRHPSSIQHDAVVKSILCSWLVGCLQCLTLCSRSGRRFKGTLHSVPTPVDAVCHQVTQKDWDRKVQNIHLLYALGKLNLNFKVHFFLIPFTGPFYAFILSLDNF